MRSVDREGAADPDRRAPAIAVFGIGGAEMEAVALNAEAAVDVGFQKGCHAVGIDTYQDCGVSRVASSLSLFLPAFIVFRADRDPEVRELENIARTGAAQLIDRSPPGIGRRGFVKSESFKAVVDQCPALAIAFLTTEALGRKGYQSLSLLFRDVGHSQNSFRYQFCKRPYVNSARVDVTGITGQRLLEK